MSKIEKRRITDHDAQVLADVGIAIAKVGIAATAFVATGPVATVGAALAYELSGVLLDSQRKRLADFAIRFSKRTAELPTDVQNRIREQLGTDAGTRIFETAWNQAAQEVDPEKLDFIAALLKNSLSSEVLRENQTRWLLKLLDALDTVQIIVLQSYAKQNKTDSAFRNKHSVIFENERHPEPPQFISTRPRPEFSSGFAPLTDKEKVIAKEYQDDLKRELDAYQSELPAEQEKYELARERHALYKSRVHNLVERGLLGIIREDDNFRNQVDKVSEGLTPLGAALLKIIDAVDPSEWGQAEQVNTVQVIQQSLVDIAQNAEKEQDEIMKALTRF